MVRRAGGAADVITIVAAGLAELPHFSRLFDLYRQFYGAASDLPAAHAFLAERLARQDSVLLGAMREGMLMGFVQLYPVPNSLSGGQLMILNDLFVDPAARGAGIARRLMQAAQDHAQAAGVTRLELSTQHTNRTAQRLYEALGWRQDGEFRYYVLELPTTR